jgi:hypothetical protein
MDKVGVPGSSMALAASRIGVTVIPLKRTKNPVAQESQGQGPIVAGTSGSIVRARRIVLMLVIIEEG